MRRGTRKPGGGKARAQFIHAMRRAKERYGIEYTQELKKDFIHQIQTSQAVHVEKKSGRVSTFLVNYQGKVLKVVYDNKRKEIVTFLRLFSGL